jgi:hypothetical protein
MTENTTQVEGLDFTVQDHTSAPTEKMTRSVEQFHSAVDRTTQKLSSLGHSTAMTALGAVGLGIGFHAIAETARDANTELEQAAKRIAGVQYTFGGWEKGISGQQKWNESLEQGQEIVERLESSESKLKMGRDDLADIYKSTTAISARYGLSQEQQLDYTEKLAAAHKVLGTSAEGASMVIGRAALTGKIRGFDDLSKTLRFGVGDLKAFSKLGEKKRFEKLQKAMGDLMPAAEGMGKGLSGSLFDIRKTVKDLTRDLTGPVFKEVTKEIGAWASRITQVREGGMSIARDYGQKLVTVFGYLKDTTSFIADHWKSIALIFGASKLVGMTEGLAAWGKKGGAGGIAGAAAGAAGAVGTMQVRAGIVNIDSSGAAGLGKPAAQALATSLRPSMAETVGRFASVAGKALMVTEALGALYIGAEGLARLLDAQQSKQLEQQRAAPRAMDALTAGAKAMSSALNERSVKETFGHLKSSFDAYGMKIGHGHLSAASIAADLRSMAPETAAKQLGMFGLKGVSAKSVQGSDFIDKAAGRVASLLNGFADQLLKAYPDLTKSGSAISPKAPINQTIQHLEIHPDFKDANPDRIWHKLTNEVMDIAHNPRGSLIPAVVR